MNWRKATHSGDNGGECVEVASASGLVMIRDTTNRDGITLSVTPSAWRRLVATARHHEGR
jgi:Domain of unknown function (DUF397)